MPEPTQPPAESSDGAGGDVSVDEVALFDALASRDSGALAALYDRYARVVFSLASRILNDSRESEEVTQDVFLSLWRNPSAFDPRRGAPISWITTITRNKCLDRLRKTNRRIPTPPPGTETGEEVIRVDEARASNPFLMAELSELSAHIRGCLEVLTAIQRSAVEMAYFEGMSHSEIAGKISESSTTVKSRLRLAMVKLRNCLVGKVKA